MVFGMTRFAFCQATIAASTESFSATPEHTPTLIANAFDNRDKFAAFI
jgi:hypothetical protein